MKRRAFGPVLCLVLGFFLLNLVAGGCGRRSGKPTLGKLEQLISTGKLSEAEALCRGVLLKDPEDFEARGSLAKVLCLQGDALLVEAGFFTRVKREQKEPITAPKYAEARKLFESAQREALEALRKEPNNGRIRGTLGMALYRIGQNQKAVEELKAALVAFKDDLRAAEVNNTLGLICYDEGKTGEALSYYQAALALDNTMPEVCYNLAILYDEEYVRVGRTEAREAAVRYYQLFRRYSKGVRDAEVEKAIKELEGPGAGAAKGAPAGGRQQP